MAHDLSKFVNECKDVEIVGIQKKLIAAVTVPDEQRFQTEIHLLTAKETIPVTKLTFHPSINNQNYAKCNRIENSDKNEHTMTIPFNYGQLPLILNLLEEVENSEGKRKLECTVVGSSEDRRLHGQCEIFTRKK